MTTCHISDKKDKCYCRISLYPKVYSHGCCYVNIPPSTNDIENYPIYSYRCIICFCPNGSCCDDHVNDPDPFICGGPWLRTVCEKHSIDHIQYNLSYRNMTAHMWTPDNYFSQEQMAFAEQSLTTIIDGVIKDINSDKYDDSDDDGYIYQY